MPASHLVRSDHWAGLRPGDEVSVKSRSAKGSFFRFIAHVKNTNNDDEWIEVVGGSAGKEQVRSFRPEEIFDPRAKEGGLSLAEAPRLPFA
jgi:hypothetical protein